MIKDFKAILTSGYLKEAPVNIANVKRKYPRCGKCGDSPGTGVSILFLEDQTEFSCWEVKSCLQFIIQFTVYSSLISLENWTFNPQIKMVCFGNMYSHYWFSILKFTWSTKLYSNIPWFVPKFFFSLGNQSSKYFEIPYLWTALLVMDPFGWIWSCQCYHIST